MSRQPGTLRAKTESVEAFAKRLEDADNTALMADPRFHRFLFRLYVKSGMWSQDYGSEHGMAYAAGRRNLGLETAETLRRVEPRILQITLDAGSLMSRQIPQAKPQDGPHDDPELSDDSE